MAALSIPQGDAKAMAELFDSVPDTVYFVKDRGGRYVLVNRTLAARTGRSHPRELVGLSAAEVFAEPLGSRIAAQDKGVIDKGVPLQGIVELHLYPGGQEGWCLTWKVPIRGDGGAITGLCGISRDLNATAPQAGGMESLSRVVDHIHANIEKPLKLSELAALAALSVYQLNQRIRGLFGLSAGQYLIQARMERACRDLRLTASAISEIALDCGYSDQAAFTRQFRKSVGLTPSQYRNLPR